MIFFWRNIISTTVKNFISDKVLIIYNSLKPHFGILCVALFVILANVLGNIHFTLAEEEMAYSNLDPSQIVNAVDQIQPYTQVLSEDVDYMEFSLLSEKSDGYISKDWGNSSVITEIAKKDFEYMIQQGDTISGIASKFGLHVASLVDMNKLSVSDLENLKAGQKIIIPVNDSSDSTQWLADLNTKKEAERQLVIKQEKEKQAKLAKANRGVVTRDSGSRKTGSGPARISTGSGSSNNGYPYGYCTYYVASRRSVPSQLGNAGQWLGNASRSGFATGDTPVPGAIMVSNESWVGHVAYVESVNGNSMTVSEMNYKGWGITSTRTIDINSSVIKGFIY